MVRYRSVVFSHSQQETVQRICVDATTINLPAYEIMECLAGCTAPWAVEC